jgi:hypothetical protein
MVEKETFLWMHWCCKASLFSLEMKEKQDCYRATELNCFRSLLKKINLSFGLKGLIWN